MNSLIQFFDDADLMPHGMCFAWRADLLATHIISDLAITIAYLVIPFALLKLVRQRKDIRYGWVLWTFAAFILLCGLTHLTNLFVLWVPDFAVQGLVKAATAVVSVATAILIWPLVPVLVKVPSHDQLQAVNDDLATEIEERKWVQDQLAEKAEELTRSNHDLEKFAYVASHDLKAPLRGVGLIVQWIEEDLENGNEEELSNHLALAKGRIVRMEKMLEDLLSFSRAGREKLVEEDIPTRNLFEECFDMVQAGRKFTLELPEEMPVLHAPKVALQQIVGNLFSNAMKHHDKESGVISVACGSRRGFWEFEIKDDGPGIPEEFRERVFGMFETLKPKDHVEGNGMGLAIARRILDMHGGSIEIAEQEASRGTTFIVKWPIEAESYVEAVA